MPAHGIKVVDGVCDHRKLHLSQLVAEHTLRQVPGLVQTAGGHAHPNGNGQEAVALAAFDERFRIEHPPDFRQHSGQIAGPPPIVGREEERPRGIAGVGRWR